MLGTCGGKQQVSTHIFSARITAYKGAATSRYKIQLVSIMRRLLINTDRLVVAQINLTA